MKELKEVDDLSGMVLIEVGDQGVDLIGAREFSAVRTIVVFFDAADARQGSHESERARLVSCCGLNPIFALLQGGLLAIAGLAERDEDQTQARMQSKPHAPNRNKIPDRARERSLPVNSFILFLSPRFLDS